MDYEEFDLLAGTCVLDVDLPTFLDDYRLPSDRQLDVAGGATSLDSFIDLESYAVNEFDGENCSNFSKSFTNNGLEQFSLLCTQEENSQTTFTSSNQQSELPSSYLAPWHENFVDVEDEFAIFNSHPNTETTFLQNVLQQAETHGSVEDFLDIVDKADPSTNSIQNPQQILEEIYRECQQIDSASPRLVTENEFNGVVEVLEYFSPPNEETCESVEQTCESEEDTASRSSNFTPDSCAWSESTMTDSVRDQDSDHNFARGVFKKKKSSSTNFRGASIKKKSQNRVAASRYRSKKKLEKNFVETEVSLLEKKNGQLKTSVGELEREIAYLKNFMSEIRAAGGKSTKKCANKKKLMKK